MVAFSSLEHRFDYASTVKVARHHVWVSPGKGSQMQPMPGLLLVWRKNPVGEYEGFVAVLTGTFHEPGERLTLQWVPASRLTPVR